MPANALHWLWICCFLAVFPVCPAFSYVLIVALKSIISLVFNLISWDAYNSTSWFSSFSSRTGGNESLIKVSSFSAFWNVARNAKPFANHAWPSVIGFVEPNLLWLVHPLTRGLTTRMFILYVAFVNRFSSSCTYLIKRVGGSELRNHRRTVWPPAALTLLLDFHPSSAVFVWHLTRSAYAR